MNDSHEIRALLAPIPGSGLLIPGSAVAEVIDFSRPVPFSAAPEWLLGELEWNGWQIPVVQFALLAGSDDEAEVAPRSRILVIRSLSMSSSVGFVGIVISGLPRLCTVTTGNLAETGTSDIEGVFSQVTVGDQEAIIPDLDALALAIENAVYRD